MHPASNTIVLEDARRQESYVEHYNNVRLHMARDGKLEAARKMRRDRRQQAA